MMHQWKVILTLVGTSLSDQKQSDGQKQKQGKFKREEFTDKDHTFDEDATVQPYIPNHNKCQK